MALLPIPVIVTMQDTNMAGSPFIGEPGAGAVAVDVVLGDGLSGESLTAMGTTSSLIHIP